MNGADVAAILYTVIESCKKANLLPQEYLKYVITERWHKRQPLSPLRYSWMKFGKPKHVGQWARDWSIPEESPPAIRLFSEHQAENNDQSTLLGICW